MTPRSPGKTPYEIRLELLILAKEILMAKHAAEAAARYSSGGWSPNESALVTTYPTSEDIISEAERLNGFVSQTPAQPR